MDWDNPNDIGDWEGNPNGRMPATVLVSDDTLDTGNITKSDGGSTERDRTCLFEGGKHTGDRYFHYGDIGDFSRYFSLDAWWEYFCKGRFPATLIVSDQSLDNGTHGHSSGKYDDMKPNLNVSDIQFLDGDERHQFGYGDVGGFSRFFSMDDWWAKLSQFLIVRKPSVKEKDAGLENLPDMVINTKTGNKRPSREKKVDEGFGNRRVGKNPHKTVKPIKLMAYCVAMGSNAGDIVLDPFAGSGTTNIAAKILGRKTIGVEIDPIMVEAAMLRAIYWTEEVVRQEEAKKNGLGKWL